MKSAIGQQNVTASALQMAMVAGTVANGGVEMTPHVMSQIRDSQGNLVKVYEPKAWQQPISAETANTLTTFMQGVVKSGTAAPVGFPAAWDVAAKTGTAQTGSFGPDPAYTDDWLIAFAPVREPQGGHRRGPPQPTGQRHRCARTRVRSSSRSSATYWPTRPRHDRPVAVRLRRSTPRSMRNDENPGPERVQA